MQEDAYESPTVDGGSNHISCPLPTASHEPESEIGNGAEPLAVFSHAEAHRVEPGVACWISLQMKRTSVPEPNPCLARTGTEELFESPRSRADVIHGCGDPVEPFDRDVGRVFRVAPAVRMRLNELDGETDGMRWIDERLVAVVRVEDLILEDRDAQVAKAAHVRFDVVGFEGEVLELLAVSREKLVDARFRVPVVDDVEPALVSEQNSPVVLKAFALVVAKVPHRKANVLELTPGALVIRHRHADVLQTDDGHTSYLILH